MRLQGNYSEKLGLFKVNQIWFIWINLLLAKLINIKIMKIGKIFFFNLNKNIILNF